MSNKYLDTISIMKPVIINVDCSAPDLLQQTQKQKHTHSYGLVHNEFSEEIHYKIGKEFNVGSNHQKQIEPIHKQTHAYTEMDPIFIIFIFRKCSITIYFFFVCKVFFIESHVVNDESEKKNNCVKRGRKNK